MKNVSIFLIIVLCLSLTGCLSIGGKTIQCEHKNVDEQRLIHLEQRLGTLEQLAGINTSLHPQKNVIE
jgi:starvation-inducible outer membrane lipoprotein